MTPTPAPYAGFDASVLCVMPGARRVESQVAARFGSHPRLFARISRETQKQAPSSALFRGFCGSRFHEKKEEWHPSGVVEEWDPRMKRKPWLTLISGCPLVGLLGPSVARVCSSGVNIRTQQEHLTPGSNHPNSGRSQSLRCWMSSFVEVWPPRDPHREGSWGILARFMDRKNPGQGPF